MKTWWKGGFGLFGVKESRFLLGVFFFLYFFQFPGESFVDLDENYHSHLAE